MNDLLSIEFVSQSSTPSTIRAGVGEIKIQNPVEAVIMKSREGVLIGGKFLLPNNRFDSIGTDNY